MAALPENPPALEALPAIESPSATETLPAAEILPAPQTPPASQNPPAPETPPALETLSAPNASPLVTIDHAEESTDAVAARPVLNSTVSDPPALESFASPMRQHRRTPSSHREIKETLDARVVTSDETDGRTYQKVNQYIIMEEIGRGSYGAVHIAANQYGGEFAVKEFSKSRLRKRAQSNILRQGPQGRPRRAGGMTDPGDGPLSPELGGLRMSEQKDALFLIREEIAIMKKLNHPNLVQLIEVLDDPDEDSLYMVLEMCKKGVIMKVGLEEKADPYPEENCRCWFRDLILGIEYLHSQGVIHRDIKPDNLLLSEDDVLKIVDFGVSEIFEKSETMRTAKSAGSPAFLSPELCGKHDEVSGEAADIWSMGISLYCLKYGKIPFNREGVLEIYEAIKCDDPKLPADESPVFVDLITKILDKNPDTRIKMPELREHPWVTKDGTDPLLSAGDNCSHVVEPPNELEIQRAFTKKVNHLLCVLKAINRFKALLTEIRARSSSTEDLAHAADAGADKEVEALIERRRTYRADDDEPGKGHAQDVTSLDPQFLGIGTGSRDDFAMDKATPDVVAESPTAVDFNIYDRAYEEAVNKRLKANSSSKPVMFLTKFVTETDQFKKLENIVEDFRINPPSIKHHIQQSAKQVQAQLATSPGGIKLTKFMSRMGISDLGKTEEPKTGAS